MTSTNIHIGLGENARNSSKVLKPPGGGSSDIFGNGSASATPRSNRGHMPSNIFAPPLEKNVNGDNHRRNANMDSHNRLFGEVDRPYTPAKNHFKSSIPFGAADAIDAAPKTNGTSGKPNGTNGHTNGNSSNGEAMLANGNSAKHEMNDSPLSNNSHASSIEEIISPRNSRIDPMNTPRRSTHTPPDNLPIRPIEINTNVQIIGTAPLTNTTNSSSFSSSTDDSNCGFTKSPRLARDRNPVTGSGIQVAFHRGRKMDGRRDGNPVTGHGYSPEINTAVPALNGTKQIINKNRIPPGGFSSGLW